MVTGALLGAPLATGCGGEDVAVNEPAPQPTINEPVQQEEGPDETPNEVAEEEPVEDEPVAEEEPEPEEDRPTVNAPPSE